jgi:hypothetical protein
VRAGVHAALHLLRRGGGARVATARLMRCHAACARAAGAAAPPLRASAGARTHTHTLPLHALRSGHARCARAPAHRQCARRVTLTLAHWHNTTVRCAAVRPRPHLAQHTHFA